MRVLKTRWQRLQARYQGLARRERGLVALATLLTPALLANTLWLEPHLQRTRALEGAISKQKLTIDETLGQLQSLQGQLRVDPDAPVRAQQQALQDELRRLDRELLQAGRALVRPQEMNALLEQLLFSQNGLRLLSLNTLPPAPLLTHSAAARKPEAVVDKAADKVLEKVVDKAVDKAVGQVGDKVAAERFNLYRHGVEIRIEGRFVDLLAYLERLEASPQKLLWGGLSYRVLDYPKAEMRLTVYTLGAEQTWLTL